MARNRENLVKWAQQKSTEYLESAQINIEAGRLFPAAEEIFRSVENSLEALLYNRGIRKIEYPGKKKKLTGRLALQFLIRYNLLRTHEIEQDVYDYYMRLATELHKASYQPSKTFKKEELTEYAKFAEDLLIKARAASSS